jgi:hypothetical protein
MRGRARAQVVGGLQALVPGQAVERVELLAAWIGDVEVERLRLVDPFLPTRRCLDQPGTVDLEGGSEERLEVVGDAVDPADRAVEIFEVGDHHLVPQAARLQLMHQCCVDHGEVAGHVRFDEQVLVGRLDRLRDTANVGDGRRRRDRHGVGVAHTCLPDALAQGIPVERRGAVHVDTGARLGQEVDGIDRQDALRPQRTVKARITPAFGGKVAGRRNRVVGDRLHAGVGEGHGSV